MKQTRRFFLLAVIAMAFYAAQPASATITIDTTTATDWKISNGVITLDWNSQVGNIFSVHLNGHPEELVDITNTNSNHQPKGFYMDNTGLGGGTTTAGFQQDGDHYLDWWVTVASNASNAFTYTRHFIITDNNPGFHAYIVINHSATDIAGGIGQVQYVFRIDQTLFNTTYSVNSGLNNLGPMIVQRPVIPASASADHGRAVQDATLDVHGLTLPAGFTRQFDTKYDYSSYEYLHRAHGVYGTTFAAWTVIPSLESLIGGPTKQDLIFTGNILMMECQSNHLDNGFTFNVPAGQVLSRLYGPYYFHFNTFTPWKHTPAALYDDALDSARPLNRLYDHEAVLLQNGYVPSNARGTVRASIAGTREREELTEWTVLSDSQTNFQYSGVGHQYWVNDEDGDAPIRGVIPGTYRLSAYVLGKWGELRRDNIAVAANQTTHLNLTFTPENFGTARPIWTIGTPDRSAHEFLHGHVVVADNDDHHHDRDADRDEHDSDHDRDHRDWDRHEDHDRDDRIIDDREYWGNWNYWQDFAANKGAVIYYATAVGTTPATNDLNQWNYVHWQTFSPGLFGGVFNPADDTTDGYKYICPAYVGDCTKAIVPPWQVHFTTTAAQQAQGQFVTMSVGLATAEASLIVTLNGQTLIWHVGKRADAQVRSGQAGTYQWVVFEWSASKLNPPGQDNVITLSTNRPQGVMYDALRMEISNKSANHTITGWNDYEFIDVATDQPANDSVPNQ